MPQSKKRVHQQPAQHHNNQTHNPRSRKPNRAVMVGVIFFALLGMGISFFIGGGSFGWLLGGLVIGGIAGYFFGKQIDRTISKK